MPENNYSGAARLGSRFNLRGFIGTVRFVGNVDGMKGIWLGVEWDDPTRGKHNGMGYFTCTVPDAGSFIRPSATITWGRSFLDALFDKYLDVGSTHGLVESIVLGSSNGTIEVQAIGMDKVRKKMSQMNLLQDISLDKENISHAGSDNLREQIGSLRSLDLSRNLFSSWEVVAHIASQLPNLTSLTLNENRFRDLGTTSTVSSFQRLASINLNGTLLDWSQILVLLPSMPSLSSIEAGFNMISRLCPRPTSPAPPKLVSINFDSNLLESWKDCVEGLAQFPCLQRVILSRNKLKCLLSEQSPQPEVVMRSVIFLSLVDSEIGTWQDIDRLVYHFPNLASLSIGGNPLFTEAQHSRNDSRQWLIARIKTLTTLNSSPISEGERRDCERLYLSQINSDASLDSEQRMSMHPRWAELCRLHGQPEEHPPVAEGRTLRNRLIALEVYQTRDIPTTLQAVQDCCIQRATFKILPTMTLSMLRLKIVKGLRLPRQISFGLWIYLDLGGGVGEFAKLGLDADDRQLDSWGVAAGTVIVVGLPT